MTWSRIKPKSQVHGSAHAKARAAAASVHKPTDLCVRCRHTLGPMGPHLHYDHDDHDKTKYLGFSHGSKPCPTCGSKCNLDAAGRLGRARQKQARPPQTGTSPLRW